MSTEEKRISVLKVISDLQKNGGVPPEVVAEIDLDPALALLRDWQVDRLKHTYADFLADPRYQPACAFFMSDIYAGRDFSRRDREFEHLYTLLSRILPEASLRVLHDAIHLNQLTSDLDNRLLRVLVDEMGMQGRLTAEMYTEAYRRCDNYAERMRQIGMLVAIVKEVGNAARLPLVGRSLRLARLPALRLGWGEVYDFLDRGYQAFRPMKDVGRLAQALDEREKRLLKQIYSDRTEG